MNPNTGSHVQSLVLDGVTEPTLAGQLIVSSACTEVCFITGPQTIYIQKTSLLSSKLSLVRLFPEHARSGKFSRNPFTEWTICLKPTNGKANSPKKLIHHICLYHSTISLGFMGLIVSSLQCFKEHLICSCHSPHCSS